MRISKFCGVLAAALVVAPAPALAHQGIQHRYTVMYHQVAHKFGERAPGRNIVRWGLTDTRRAHRVDIRKSIAVLDRMLHPPVVATTYPGPFGAATTAASAPGSSQAACIISRESGGNPQASNGTHFGIAQWSPATWVAHGGPAMTGQTDPRNASYGQQVAVLNHALQTVGSGDWSPYDGC